MPCLLSSFLSSILWSFLLSSFLSLRLVSSAWAACRRSSLVSKSMAISRSNPSLMDVVLGLARFGHVGCIFVLRVLVFRPRSSGCLFSKASSLNRKRQRNRRFMLLRLLLLLLLLLLVLLLWLLRF